MDNQKNLITFDFTKLQVVPLNSVRPNPWNPKDKGTKQYRELVESIRINGLRDFIKVRENQGWEIIDGEQTWTACKELGYTQIVIYNCGVVEDKIAMQDTLWWQIQIPFNKATLAQLMKKMLSEFKEVKVPYADKQVKQAVNKKITESAGKVGSKVKVSVPKGEMLKSFMVQMTATQYDILQLALKKARENAILHSDSPISDSKALEFICAEYLNTPAGK